MNCVHKIWSKYHYYPCKNPAKWFVDLGTQSKTPLCGVHALKHKRAGKAYELAPLSVTQERA